MTRVFTTVEFADVAGLREELALQFLRDFQTQGLVERRLRSGWSVTRRGLALSRTIGAIEHPTLGRAA